MKEKSLKERIEEVFGPTHATIGLSKEIEEYDFDNDPVFKKKKDDMEALLMRANLPDEYSDLKEYLDSRRATTP